MIEKFAMSAVEMNEVRDMLFEAFVESGLSYEEIAQKVTLVIQSVCENADIAISAEQAAHAAELAALNKKVWFWFIVGIIGIVGMYSLCKQIDRLDADKKVLERRLLFAKNANKKSTLNYNEVEEN